MHRRERAGGDAEARAPVGLEPGAPLGHAFRAPGSKSLAQRYAVVASLARGATALDGWPEGDDAGAALALVAAAGARVERLGPASVRITGLADRRWSGAGPFDAGESATLARLASGVLALAATTGAARRLDARGTLRARTSAPLFDALVAAGARVRFAGPPAGFPVEIEAAVPPDALRLVAPISSQEASALAIAASAWDRPIRIAIDGDLPSGRYFAMTLSVLERFGARIERAGSAGVVRGPLRAPAAPLAIEPDASTAAVALAAACLSGGELLATGFHHAPFLQGDVRIVEHLAAFGCRAERRPDALFAAGRPTRAAELDLSGEPDLAPPLAAVAAARALVAPAGERPSRLTGLGALRNKESARVEVLAQHLAELGLAVDAGPAHLSIGPGRPTVGELVLDAASDHRIAFFVALLGLVRPGVRLADAAPVAKSWPRFFDDLAALGATVARSG